MAYRSRWLWAFVWLSANGAGCAHEAPNVDAMRVKQAAVEGPVAAPAPALVEPAPPSLGTPKAEDTALGVAPLAPPPPAKKAENAPVMADQLSRETVAEARRPARPSSAPGAAALAPAGSLGMLGQGTGGGGVHARIAMQRAQPLPEMDREAYAHIAEKGFENVKDGPLSTFSIDVDTASYANVRRFLRDGSLPPADAVRIEELVNYFDYDYPAPQENEPFSLYAEVGDCPWNRAHRLVHIGVQGRVIEQADVPARNLVFLVDVSGSMQDANKLPLLKRGLAMLTESLRPQDHVSIAVYAGSSGLALPSTSGRDSARILEALQRLEAGGSTNGAEGIELAYREAQQHFVKGGINRVILATDGDFNVGVTSEGELVRLIEEKRKSGVFLTVLGFGTGNLQDSRMEQLADKGNGNYAYVDSIAEAHKVLVREAGSTLVTIAKDVKLQVEWNPALVASYRLIGYENRALAARDFNDDKKDAGEIGAGHNVTALYEIVPKGSEEPSARPEVDPLRYQTERADQGQAYAHELLTLKVRYKEPSADSSRLLTRTLVDAHRPLDASSDSFRFSAAVAGFGMLLRNSEYKGTATLNVLTDLARGASARDPHGDRGELLDMMQAAGRLGLGS